VYSTPYGCDRNHTAVSLGRGLRPWYAPPMPGNAFSCRHWLCSACHPLIPPILNASRCPRRGRRRRGRKSRHGRMGRGLRREGRADRAEGASLRNCSQRDYRLRLTLEPCSVECTITSCRRQESTAFDQYSLVQLAATFVRLRRKKLLRRFPYCQRTP
jgi:hypothetical protein